MSTRHALASIISPTSLLIRCAVGAFVVGALTLGSSSTAAAQSPGGLERHSFDSDGFRIHYTVEGEGPPVLLIHGYRASGDLNWRLAGMNRTLADSYRVITIDNRGHGDSTATDDPADYGRNMVRDQIRLLDHLGIEAAHIVGYSMGGMIALRLAADHPDRALSVAICGMGWTRDDAGTRARFASGPEASRRPARDPARTAQLAAVYRSFGELGLTEAELDAVELPTVLIVGDRDPLYESSVVPLQAARPDLPLRLIEGGSHTSTPLKGAFHDAVEEWLDAQSASD